MNAGRNLDALVAEKVMGWTNIHESREMQSHGNYMTFVRGTNPKVVESFGLTAAIYEIPNYSTDIAAAWAVVERMKDLGWSFRYGNNGCARDQHAAAFAQAYRGLGAHILTGKYIERDGSLRVDKTAPLSICRSALKALGVEVSQ